jgi:mercuric ion transport protein
VIEDCDRELSIDLIYDRTCPNVDETRNRLRAALAETVGQRAWSEWDREDSETPDAFRGYGSPTVLINGLDVDRGKQKAAPADPDCCRLYEDGAGHLTGVPSVESISSLIREAGRR